MLSRVPLSMAATSPPVYLSRASAAAPLSLAAASGGGSPPLVDEGHQGVINLSSDSHQQMHAMNMTAEAQPSHLQQHHSHPHHQQQHHRGPAIHLTSSTEQVVQPQHVRTSDAVGLADVMEGGGGVAEAAAAGGEGGSSSPLLAAQSMQADPMSLDNAHREPEVTRM